MENNTVRETRETIDFSIATIAPQDAQPTGSRADADTSMQAWLKFVKGLNKVSAGYPDNNGCPSPTDSKTTKNQS